MTQCSMCTGANECTNCVNCCGRQGVGEQVKKEETLEASYNSGWVSSL